MNRFTDNGNGTVTDTTTGLVWQQADDGIKGLGKRQKNTPSL